MLQIVTVFGIISLFLGLAIAGDMVPLKGSLGGDRDGFSGNFTHLGSFDGVYDYDEDTAVWTAANGDEVYVRTTDFATGDCLNPPYCYVFTYVQVLTIMGGTGRFDNADGSGTVEGVINFDAGEFYGYLQGTITRPNSRR